MTTALPLLKLNNWLRFRVLRAQSTTTDIVITNFVTTTLSLLKMHGWFWHRVLRTQSAAAEPFVADLLAATLAFREVTD